MEIVDKGKNIALRFWEGHISKDIIINKNNIPRIIEQLTEVMDKPKTLKEINLRLKEVKHGSNIHR